MGWLSKIVATVTCASGLLALVGAHAPLDAQVDSFVADHGVERLKTVTSDSFVSTRSPRYHTLTSTTISTPPTGTYRLVARFSGESTCTVTNAFCTLRILIDGNEMQPAAGTEFAFDSCCDGFETQAIDRTSHTFSAGRKTITVQWARLGTNGFFGLDDWQLTLELWRVSD